MFTEMSVEEKKAFVEKMQSEEMKKRWKYGADMIRSTLICGIIGFIVIILVIVVGKFKWMSNSFNIMMLAFFGCAFTVIDGLVKGYKILNSVVKDASFGQVTYKDYRWYGYF